MLISLMGFRQGFHIFRGKYSIALWTTLAFLELEFIFGDLLQPEMCELQAGDIDFLIQPFFTRIASVCPSSGVKQTFGTYASSLW